MGAEGDTVVTRPSAGVSPPFSKLLVNISFLLPVAMPGAPSSVLALSSDARSP